MTAIRYAQPWSLHHELLNEVNRFFNYKATDGATAEWTPRVDIEEHADKFVLFVDVPGIDPASIEVTLEKGVLTLSGAREKAAAKEGVESRRVERATGRFERRFTLPDTADADNVSAAGKHGVLEVTIPKRPQTQPRRIAVTH